METPLNLKIEPRNNLDVFKLDKIDKSNPSNKISTNPHIHNRGLCAGKSVTLSILDRLLTNETVYPNEKPRVRQLPTDQLRDFLRRDIEALLNTRLVRARTPKDFPELANSVLTYGIGSFASVNLNNDEARLSIAKTVQDSITRAYPRFKNLRVTIINNQETEQRNLKMRIEAQYCYQQPPQIVYFDTKLHYFPQQFTVEVIDE